MQCQDRVQRAVALVVQIEERFPFPKNGPTRHPIELIKEAEQQLATPHCVTYGEAASSLEQHHVAGAANFPDTISLCKTCHDEVTNLFQAKWLPWRNTQRDQLECYILGWSDIFHLLWQNTGHQYFRELSKAFVFNARYAK
jgi:hypothetical protein